ncbi:MAG: diacylglycerol kinase family protein [Candidatus Omnitrophica bacterium]|jgi:diacylglycerol kinase|nr:diacylglycerol kinase family protein [Candidatus Omnitrophota bacterium]
MSINQELLEKKVARFAEKEVYSRKNIISQLILAKEANLGFHHKIAYRPRRPVFKSFKFAYQGLVFAFRTQTNLRIHILLGTLVVILGIIFKLNSFELVVLSLVITSVIFAELMNTALEISLDWINGSKYNPLVKIVKDMTAAAVLLTSINAVIVGVIIFSKYFIKLL